MPPSLIVTSIKAASINPVLSADGTTLVGLNVTLDIVVTDLAGKIPPAPTQQIFDGWAALSAQQKVNMQDIRDTIVAAVTAAVTA